MRGLYQFANTTNWYTVNNGYLESRFDKRNMLKYEHKEKFTLDNYKDGVPLFILPYEYMMLTGDDND